MNTVSVLEPSFVHHHFSWSTVNEQYGSIYFFIHNWIVTVAPHYRYFTFKAFDLTNKDNLLILLRFCHFFFVHHLFGYQLAFLLSHTYTHTHIHSHDMNKLASLSRYLCNRAVFVWFWISISVVVFFLLFILFGFALFCFILNYLWFDLIEFSVCNTRFSSLHNSHTKDSFMNCFIL